MMGIMASPLRGADGNVEFLAHARAHERGRPRSTSTRSSVEAGEDDLDVDCGHERPRRTSLSSCTGSAPRPPRWRATSRRGWSSAGHQVRVPTPDAEQTGLEEWACDPDKLTVGLDLAVSLGGDGTMLRTVRLVVRRRRARARASTSAASATSPRSSRASSAIALERFLAGDYGIEERLMIEVEVEAPSGALPVGPAHRAQRGVVEKPSSGHTVQPRGRRSTSDRSSRYAADGLIVATPDRLDRVHLLGPRPDHLADAARALADAGLRAHAVRPLLVLGPDRDDPHRGHRRPARHPHRRRRGARACSRGATPSSAAPHRTSLGWSPSATATSTASSRPSSGLADR